MRLGVSGGGLGAGGGHGRLRFYKIGGRRLDNLDMGGGSLVDIGVSDSRLGEDNGGGGGFIVINLGTI